MLSGRPAVRDMKRIIFVDDEPRVLQGLQRMLRPLRHEWDMAFMESGKEVLDTLAERPVNVVVSDLQMPGMDGTALFAEIRQRHPEVVRIVLSGHLSKGTTRRAVGVAHQYVSKPCDAEILKRTINRAFGLRTLLDDESLTRLLAQTQSLPSLPSLYAEIIAELQKPNMSIKKVGEIISKDAAMTAKVLQLVNSAFFGLPRHVSGPAQAAILLGTDTIQALALGLGIFSEFKKPSVSALKLEPLWKHTVQTAALAKKIAIAETAEREVADDALMAGVLHDVGKLVLAQNFPKRYDQATQRAREKRIGQVDAEREVFGATHGEVGAYLLGLWGLPDPIVEAVAFHHCPAKAMEIALSPLTAVHAANILEHNQNGAQKDNGLSQLDLHYLSDLGLADRIPAWQDICKKVFDEGSDG